MTEVVKDQETEVEETVETQVEDKSTEAPKEEVKPKYNPDDLTKDGWVSPEEAARIRKALADANEADKNKRLKLKAYEEAGMTPDEIAELTKQRQELELQRAKENKNFEDYTNTLKNSFETKINTYKEQLEEKDGVVNRYKSTLEKTLIDKELQSAIVELGGKSVNTLTKLLRENIKLNETEDGSFEVYAVDQFGQPEEKDGKRIGIKDYVAKMREDSELGLLFDAPKIGGSGSQANSASGKPTPPKVTKRELMKNPAMQDKFILEYGIAAYHKLKP